MVEKHMGASADSGDALRRFFAALSDESRLRIVAALTDEALGVAELAGKLGLKGAAVAKHLSVLVEAGLVTTDDDRRFRLDIAGLRAQRRALLARTPSPSPADEPGTPAWERSVLGAFFDGDRLRSIPVDLKKRRVVLSWLAGRFQPGRRYPERDVNDILQRHHPDFATLRRELVDHRFMAREAGHYWLLTE
jgi:DNA-binding transcriptional ArsR family regulator